MTKPPIYVRSRKIPASRCPQCDALLDGVTAVGAAPEDTIPTIGRLTVCCYCGTLLEIVAGGIQAAAAERMGELSAFELTLLQATIGRTIRTSTGSPSDAEKRIP